MNKLTPENFTARLKQANLESKTDIANFVKKTYFDVKLKTLNEISKKVKLLSSKRHSFLLGRMYFTSDDGFQNIFVYQPTFNTIKYKKHKH